MFTSKKIRQQLHECETRILELSADLAAVKDNVATVEFTPDGTILSANDRFLSVVGYSIEQIRGKHHRMFCEPEYVQSAEYRRFWDGLAQGQSYRGTFHRLNAAGSKVWLEATYFPVTGTDGRVVKVIKIAADVTGEREEYDDKMAVLSALDRSLAVIEFTPQGQIISANQNFLDVVGCSLSQVQGQHHRIFCDDEFYREHPDFWSELERGSFKSGQFERRRASGEPVWLEATYNPVLDEHGRTVRVIKFASDITRRVEHGRQVRQAAEAARATAESTAEQASQGHQILEAAAQTATEISGEVNKVAELLARLSEHSKNIEQIVATINEIAEQTNLLALNAAIEAARAGETGRGFAVVADEVRKLAARTSHSTAEIATVVQENQSLTSTVTASMAEVASIAEQGSHKTSQVATVMIDIHSGARQVSERVENLAGLDF